MYPKKANPYRRMMKATREHTVLPNLLKRNSKQNIPGKVYLKDITYLFYGKNKKIYLSTIIYIFQPLVTIFNH